MTNGEIKLENAINALEGKKLSSYEADFIESIRNYSKKEIAKLSSKQYDLLCKCANK
jgi:hypothetical protein